LLFPVILSKLIPFFSVMLQRLSLRGGKRRGGEREIRRGGEWEMTGE